MCDTVERCGGDIDGDCVGGCQASQRGYRRRVTEQALHEEALCLLEEPCREDRDELFESCFVQAGEGVEITSGATEFCETMGDTFFRCAWYSAPSQCAQQNARFTDAALSAGARCAGTPCDELEACLDDTLWTFGE